jgi:hypothetical protein
MSAKARFRLLCSPIFSQRSNPLKARPEAQQRTLTPSQLSPAPPSRSSSVPRFINIHLVFISDPAHMDSQRIDNASEACLSPFCTSAQAHSSFPQASPSSKVALRHLGSLTECVSAVEEVRSALPYSC